MIEVTWANLEYIVENYKKKIDFDSIAKFA